MSYPLLMLWTLWNSWLEMCIIPQPSCFSHWERKLSQIIKQISNRGKTRRLIPYTGFDWPEPVIPHTCFLFVYWDRNTEKWIGFLCVASGISNTLYSNTLFFIYLFYWQPNHQLLSRQRTRPSPSGLNFPVWLLLPPLPSCPVHTFYILLTLGSTICFHQKLSLPPPKPSQGASPHSLYHMVL